jgi:hypothetical protein
MSLSNFAGRIHPSVYRRDGGFLRWATASPRPHGALRYVCPVTGSFVLVTDEATLQRLAGRRGRLRCPDCGEFHLILRDGDKFVAKPPKS